MNTTLRLTDDQIYQVRCGLMARICELDARLSYLAYDSRPDYVKAAEETRRMRANAVAALTLCGGPTHFDAPAKAQVPS